MMMVLVVCVTFACNLVMWWHFTFPDSTPVAIPMAIRIATSAGPRQWRSPFTVVMSHSKPIQLPPDAQHNENEATNYDYVSLTAAANYLYATRHGYQFAYYQWPNGNKDANLCPHSVLGARSSPWCKLVAVYDQLFMFGASNSNSSHYNHDEIAIFVDSDAVFAQPNVSMSDHLPVMRFRTEGATVASSHVMTPNNYPYNVADICTCTFLLRRSQIGHCLMHRWWNSDRKGCVDFQQHNTFEQHCLQTIGGGQSAQYSNYVSLLDEQPTVNRSGVADETQFWIHVNSIQPKYRMPIFVPIVQRYLADPVMNPSKLSLGAVLRQITRYHTVLMNTGDAAQIDLETKEDQQQCLSLLDKQKN
jgi:hypothetical protein